MTDLDVVCFSAIVLSETDVNAISYHKCDNYATKFRKIFWVFSYSVNWMRTLFIKPNILQVADAKLVSHQM